MWRRRLRTLIPATHRPCRRTRRPPRPRRRLRTLIPATLLLLLLGGCGTHNPSPTGATAGIADLQASEASDSAAATPARSGASGRDPPTGWTPGDDDASAEGESDWVPNAVVERVIDGDTLVARIGNGSETVRLIGIDAPESVAPTRPVQCFGKEASLFLAGVLPAGTEITLMRDAEARDIYDRLLGYVVRSRDGLFVNLEMVATGYAAAMNYPPNDHYADAFDRAQSDAVASGQGLWRVCGGPDVPLN